MFSRLPSLHTRMRQHPCAEVSHKTLCHRASDTVDAAAACLGLLHQANRTFGLRPIALRVQGDKIPSLYLMRGESGCSLHMLSGGTFKRTGK